MGASIIVSVLLVLNFTSIWMMYKLVDIGVMNSSERMVKAISVFGFLIVGTTYFLFKRRYTKVDRLIYVVAFFTWHSLTHIVRALEKDGFIPTTLNPWCFELYPNMVKSINHARVFFYHNGTVHFILGIAFIGLHAKRASHREVGLYYAASMLNGYIVFIFTWLHGKHEYGSQIFADLVPIVITSLLLICLLNRRPAMEPNSKEFPPVWKRPIDFAFFLFFLFATIVAGLRGFAVTGANVKFVKEYKTDVEPYLNDPSGAPKFQMLLYMFVHTVYYLLAMHGLWNPSQASWMSDMSIVHAGAAGQAQFCYILGGLSSLTSQTRRFPTKGQASVEFWTVNLLLLVVPHLFALWTHYNQDTYGKTHTTDLACLIEERKEEKKQE